MAADPDVVEVHDLHVWTVTSGFPALSAHVVGRRGADRDLVRARRRAAARASASRSTTRRSRWCEASARRRAPDRTLERPSVRTALDDHLDGAAVDAPGGAGDVGGPLGAEEDDRGGDLARPRRGARSAGRRRPSRAPRRGSRSPTARPTGRRARPRRPTARTSSGRGRSRSRARRRRRSGRRRAATATAAPPSRPSTRACSARAASPAVLETFTTRPQPRSRMPGTTARIARRQRHHVHLPGRLPVLVGHVVEVAPPRRAGVVDEHVHGPEALAASAAMRSPASGSVTSQESASARPPAAAHRSAAALRRASCRSARRAARALPRRRAGARSRGRCRGSRRSRRTLLPARPRSMRAARYSLAGTERPFASRAAAGAGTGREPRPIASA